MAAAGPASSYFAGSAILPSQRAAAAPDNSAVVTSSPAKSRDPRFSGCAPTTVRHIARSFAAADATGGGDPVIYIDGVDATNVWILGRVVSVVNMEAGVSFTLDDGTGRIPLVRWITDDIDAKEVSFVQNGLYLKVQVTLVGFRAKQHGFARSIRPVTNFNEVVLHFIESMYVHLVNVWPKTQGQFPRTVQANASTHEMQAQVAHTVQTNAPAYMPFSGGVREHQVGFGPDVNQGRFPSSVQTNTSTHVPFSGGVREQQVHFTPQPNQVLVDNSMIYRIWFWRLCNNQIYLHLKMEYMLMKWQGDLECQEHKLWSPPSVWLIWPASIPLLMTIISSLF
ncbi:hypothetical protein SORBI_3010G243100 [Sorghum bicolor]|uniref:OB domain-containing protein n=1 Tax=Sorghum bicolor TaxID=4558 RepID=A0A194YL58_SORBI|nr:hypothetical protein SORBI_3010G243100 [Sorghum bicolor]